MASLVSATDPVLRTRAEYVPCGAQAIDAAAKMIKVMKLGRPGMRGIGLAAPQIGLSWRLIVTEAFGAPAPRVFVDPEIVDRRGKLKSDFEGCLSLPGKRVRVERHAVIMLQWMTPYGEVRGAELNGVLARVIQHEIDHLNGIMIDRYEALDAHSPTQSEVSAARAGSV